jgi:phage terminase Nu1 subunit (DNA packaging protein)
MRTKAQPRHLAIATTESIHVSRLRLSELLGLHVETITDLVRTAGLGGAIVRDGGHGVEQVFDLTLAVRWHSAYRCAPNGPKNRCAPCQEIVDDLKFRDRLRRGQED